MCGRGGEVAEGEVLPVVAVAAVGAAVVPGRVVADAGDADEEVDVAHDLGEDERRHLVERDGRAVSPMR